MDDLDIVGCTTLSVIPQELVILGQQADQLMRTKFHMNGRKKARNERLLRQME